MADEWSAAKKWVGLVFRIATVGFSLYSGITTATSSETLKDDGSTVSSSDYPSLQYASVADLVSAVLEVLAIYLEVVGAKKMSKMMELIADLIDKVVVALTSSSTALLFAVDEITSCGPRRRSVCSQTREFCGQIKKAAGLSLGGTISISTAVYIKRAPAALPLAGAFFVWVCQCCPSWDNYSSGHSDDTIPDSPPPPPSPPKHKHNVELLVTGGTSPCHPPTGLRLSVSSRYDDEDDESGRDE